ncbi:unnamed protein product [Alternaria alternata]
MSVLASTDAVKDLNDHQADLIPGTNVMALSPLPEYDEASSARPSFRDMITMEEFIQEKDRNNFVWVHEREEDGSATDVDPEQVLRLPKHVKLKPEKGTIFLPFHKHKRLGTGRNTKVFKGTFPKSGYERPLAIKVLDCLLQPTVTMDKALREVQIMERLEHPHVVMYVASYEMTTVNQDGEIDDQRLGIVMYPPGVCNLCEALDKISMVHNKGPSTHLDDNTLSRIRHMFGYFGCLAQALNYIHTTVVKHKDIKPENIVIDHFDQPIITDFNISKRYMKKGEETTTGGEINTPKYAAPEDSEPLINCGFYSDVFSLGCVFMEMATILLGGTREDLSAYFGDSHYYQVTKKMQIWILNKMPQIRPTLGTQLDTLLEKDSGSLGKTARQTLLDILPMIARMVELEIALRPHAQELFVAFEQLYHFTPGACVCRHCKAQCGNRPMKIEPELEHVEKIDSPQEDLVHEHSISVYDPEMLHEPPSQGEASLLINQTHHDTASATSNQNHHQMRHRAVLSPMRRRTTTASLARRDRKARKILVYEHSAPSGRRVTIGDTSILNRESCGTIV